ncbi:snare associated Golgi protein-domain-containing protein [Dissophora ornata]|nr:snare associated Golgi protein-domain-containing protein [Dissophora ornata]
MWTCQTYIKAGLLATLLTLIILSFTVFRIQDHIKDILQYIDSHKRIGAVLFVLSYTVACTLFLPGSLFTIGAGFMFKPFPLALAIVLLGDIFAAASSFVFGRYVFYDWVKGMMSKHPKFNALDQVIQDDGWKIVVMLRLTPIPFSLITYFFSITSIRLITVVWATCVGVLPGSCIGIWIGSLLKGLSGIDNPELENKNLVILVMNGVFIVCCILTLSIFGKRSLRKAMKRLEQHQALTSLEEVEVVVEGVATVIRDLEDRASIPPSFRSTMIEQLAAEETDPDYYYRADLEAAPQSLLSDREGREGEEEEEEQGESSSRTSATVADAFHHHLHNKTHGNEARTEQGSSGFTRGEKITFIVIAVVAVVNVCVCVPLYHHFASQDD